MGQFSVEICHLVGQFSMKLNIEGMERGAMDVLGQQVFFGGDADAGVA